MSVEQNLIYDLGGLEKKDCDQGSLFVVKVRKSVTDKQT